MKRLFTSLLLTLFAFGGGTAWAEASSDKSYVKGQQITTNEELQNATYIAVEAIAHNCKGFFGDAKPVYPEFQKSSGVTVYKKVAVDGNKYTLQLATTQEYLKKPALARGNENAQFTTNQEEAAQVFIKLTKDDRLGNPSSGEVGGADVTKLWRIYTRLNPNRILNTQGQSGPIGWRGGTAEWTTFRLWQVDEGKPVSVTIKYQYNGQPTTISKTVELSTNATYAQQGITIPEIYGVTGTATPALSETPSAETKELIFDYVDDSTKPLPFKYYKAYDPSQPYSLFKLKGKYVKYTEGANQDRNILLEAKEEIADPYLFQFVGDPVEGFLVYNKQKSSEVALGVNDKTQDNATFNVKDNSKAVRLHLKKKEQHYYFLLDGTTENYVNARSRGTEEVDRYTSTWKNASALGDPGSRVDFQIVDQAFLTNRFESEKNGLHEALKSLDFFRPEDYKEALNTLPVIKDQDTYLAAKKQLQSSALPKDGDLMRIQPLFHSNTSQKRLSGTPKEDSFDNAMVKNLLSQVQESTAGNDLATVFLYQDGKLICLGTSKALQQGETAALVGSYEEGSNVVFTMTPDNVYNIQVGEKYLKADANNNYGFAVSRVGDNDGRLMLKKVSALPLPIKDLGYATFWTPVAVTLPEGDAYTAYKAKKGSNEQLLLEKITGTIPAKTAFIVKGQGDTTCNLTVKDTAPETAVADNELVGAATNQEIQPTEEYFALTKSKNSNEAVFGKLPSSMKRIAFKAYWKSTSSATTNAPEFSFHFVQPTAILSPATQADLAAPYYDLSGRRVQQPVKGGLYLQAGKKVIAQ